MDFSKNRKTLLVVLLLSAPLFTYANDELKGLGKQYKKISNTLEHKLEIKLDEQSFEDLFFEGLEASFSMLNTLVVEREWNKDSVQSYFTEIYESLIIKNIHDDHFPQKNENYNRIRKNKITLKKFSGQWFGKWRDINVDHVWLPPVRLNKTLTINSTSFSLKAYQSAFTGDGIGWNYLIEQDGELYLLGMTYHYEAKEITMRRPHVGLSQSKNTIVWLTKDHTYFEYLCHCDKIGLPEHYVIDGVYFFRNKEKEEQAEGFRAIYSRGDVNRYDFHSFHIDLTQNSRIRNAYMQQNL